MSAHAFSLQRIRTASFKLIIDLMFQAGPEILRDRADLDFHLGFHRTFREINGDRHHHVITFVAVWLGFADVILHIKNRNVFLSGDHVRDLVNILVKRTDDADSRNVTEFLYHVFNGDLIAIALHFLDDAVRSLDPGFDVFDGRMPIHMDELFV